MAEVKQLSTFSFGKAMLLIMTALILTLATVVIIRKVAPTLGL